MNTKTKPEEAAKPPMPMFYKSPRPLDRVRDAKMKMNRPTSFKFAEKTNAIPLLIEEFPPASAFYPIVFADGPVPVPCVVVGLKNDENLFVNADGSWVPGSYLPTYVRRYPFILMDDPNNKQFVLCIDEESGLMKEEGEFPLFENDQPSAFTKSAMDFCGALRQQGDATDEFVKALKEHDLLAANNAEIVTASGEKFHLSGFLIIDPKKFDELPDSVILQWRKKGWLGLIYAQLLSSHKWQSLLDLLQSKKK